LPGARAPTAGFIAVQVLAARQSWHSLLHASSLSDSEGSMGVSGGFRADFTGRTNGTAVERALHHEGPRPLRVREAFGGW
jgi:hypothetical protein